MSIYLKIYFTTPSDADDFCHDYPEALRYSDDTASVQLPDGMRVKTLLKPYDVADYDTFDEISDRVNHEQ